MGRLKVYTVRLWHNGARTDAEVLGIVEELEHAEKRSCETVEEFIEALRAQRGRRPRRKRPFASFEELRRILES